MFQLKFCIPICHFLAFEGPPFGVATAPLASQHLFISVLFLCVFNEQTCVQIRAQTIWSLAYVLKEILASVTWQWNVCGCKYVNGQTETKTFHARSLGQQNRSWNVHSSTWPLRKRRTTCKSFPFPLRQTLKLPERVYNELWDTRIQRFTDTHARQRTKRTQKLMEIINGQNGNEKRW